MNKDLSKQYILWIYYGSDGWTPTGFDTIKEALDETKYGNIWKITKNIDYKVTEKRHEQKERKD